MMNLRPAAGLFCNAPEIWIVDTKWTSTSLWWRSGQGCSKRSSARAEPGADALLTLVSALYVRAAPLIYPPSHFRSMRENVTS